MLKDLTKAERDIPDFNKWVNKLCDKLFNEKVGDERMRLNRQQMQVLRSLQCNRFNIIKGFRCCGLSISTKKTPNFR